jgi:hypothetical protein
MAVDYVCNVCGGNDVSRDAWADWDAGTQDWVLRTAFDHAHCHTCEFETRLVEVDRETREPTGD